MARSNTPSAYKCGSCGTSGHNARTCPNRQNQKKSDTQILKEQRAAKRAIREARKAEKEAKKNLRSSPAAIQKEIEQVIAAGSFSRPRDFETAEVPVEPDERPVVDIPPVISKLGDATYVVSGSVRVAVPDDTQFSDIASFVQYIPPVSTGKLSLFSSKSR